MAWISAERLPAALAVFPDVSPIPPITAPATVRHDWTSIDARVAMVRGLMEICGPTTGPVVAERLSITPSQATAALEALEGEGVVLRGRFTPQDESAADSQPPLEWCHRRLLARIHRLTVDGLRKQIQPVDVRIFWRFVSRHQGLVAGAEKQGPTGYSMSSPCCRGSMRRPFAGSGICCRRGFRAISRSGSTSCAWPGMSAGADCFRRRKSPTTAVRWPPSRGSRRFAFFALRFGVARGEPAAGTANRIAHESGPPGVGIANGSRGHVRRRPRAANANARRPDG